MRRIPLAGQDRLFDIVTFNDSLAIRRVPVHPKGPQTSFAMLMSFVMAENDAKPGSSEPCDAALNDCTFSNVVNVPFVIAPAAQMIGKSSVHTSFFLRVRCLSPITE